MPTSAKSGSWRWLRWVILVALLAVGGFAWFTFQRDRDRQQEDMRRALNSLNATTALVRTCQEHYQRPADFCETWAAQTMQTHGDAILACPIDWKTIATNDIATILVTECLVQTNVEPK